jgi:hypothetical protein
MNLFFKAVHLRQFLGAALLCVSGMIAAQTDGYAGKLQHPVTADDRFGTSLAWDGKRAAVGAPRTTVDTIAVQGAVYTYELPSPAVLETYTGLKLTNGVVRQLFGTSLAFSGKTLLVGAPENGNVGPQGWGGGKVHIFTDGPASGTYTSSFSNTLLTRFGQVLAAFGTRLFATNDSNLSATLVYTTVASYPPDSSQQYVETIPAKPLALAGTKKQLAAAIGGNQVVIYRAATREQVRTVPGSNVAAAGKRFLVRNTLGNSIPTVTVLDNKGNQRPLVPPANADSSFGQTLAGSTKWLAVGSPSAEVNSIPGAGRVDLYDSKGEFVRSYTDPEPSNSGSFGLALAVCGRYLLVGDPLATAGATANAGEVYVFQLP